MVAYCRSRGCTFTHILSLMTELVTYVGDAGVRDVEPGEVPQSPHRGGEGQLVVEAGGGGGDHQHTRGHRHTVQGEVVRVVTRAHNLA